MKPDFDTRKIKFSILQITYWCAYCAFSSFMAAYMQSKGMAATVLGFMLTINTLSAFVGQFFWGMLCDRYHTNKKIFIFASAFVFIVEILIMSTNNWTMIIITFGLLGFVQQPMVANLDTWILKTYQKTPQVYGPIRSSASIAFAMFSFFYGNILEKYGYNNMLFFSAFFLGVGMITAVKTTDAPKIVVLEVEHKKKDKAWISLALNPEYRMILFLLLGTGIASAPVMQLMALIMNNVGGTVSYVGYAMFVSSTMQVPFLVFAEKLGKYSPKMRMILASVFYFISMMGMSFGNTPLVVLIFCGMNGIGFGMFLPALRESIFVIAPKELNTTAQGICDAVYTSLGSMISNILAGTLIDNYSVNVMLWVCSGIQIIAVVGFTIWLTQTKKDRKE